MRRLVFFVAMLVAAATFAYVRLAAQTAAKPLPLRLAIVDDISGSTAIWRHFSKANFEQAQAAVERTKGELAIGLIADGDVPFVRGRACDSDDPYDRKRCQEEGVAFHNAVVKLLSRPTSRTTDLVQPLRRAKLFFGEATGRERKVLIVISDCVHNATKERAPEMPDDVETLVVSGARSTPVFTTERHFESIDAALDYVNRKEN